MKFDVWVLPFLNVFALYGNVDVETKVDVSTVPLPLPISELSLDSDGHVYGGGLTFAVGGDHWFGTVTATRVRSNLSGNFDSSVRSTTWQPRLGLVLKQWQVWVGGLRIKTEEHHEGVFDFPGLGPVPFSVELGERKPWSPVLGARYDFDRRFNVTAEVGGGARDTFLINGEWRFGSN